MGKRHPEIIGLPGVMLSTFGLCILGSRENVNYFVNYLVRDELLGSKNS